MIQGIGTFDPAIKALRAKDCIFRIFRDTRFSHDKSPYKTNFGAYLTPGGKKSGLAGYYFHLSPEEPFLGGGSYCPEPDKLVKIRQFVAEHYQKLRKIMSESVFKKTFGELWGEKLKTAPKGFPKDHPAIDFLQHKSFVAVHELDGQDVLAKSAVDDTVKIFKLMQPLNQFLNQALMSK